MISKRYKITFKKYKLIAPVMMMMVYFTMICFSEAAIIIQSNNNTDAFGGIVLTSENQTGISWTATANATKYELDFSINGGAFLPISKALTTRSFNWRIVQVKQTQPNCQIKVIARDSGGNILTTQLSSLFTIIPLDKYLRFLNISNTDIQENDITSKAYYAAIDPTNSKLTLKQWLAANGFSIITNTTDDFPYSADSSAIYLNDADLGFGRRMFLKTNNSTIPPTVASCVQNYKTLTDAINNTNLIATVCMEYTSTNNSPLVDTDPGLFTKFYVFNNGLSFTSPGTGQLSDMNRISSADLDNSGQKYVPGLCLTCHGGTPKPLISPISPAVTCTTDTDCVGVSSGAVCQKGICAIYPNSGDAQAGFIPWDLDNLQYSTTAPYRKSDQEAQFRGLNQGALNTLALDPNVIPNCTSARTPYDCCTGTGTGTCTTTPDRQELINGWYGGIPSGLTLPPNNFNSNFVPTGWKMQKSLYQNVVAPNCRACHTMREPFPGINRKLGEQDFSNYGKYLALTDYIESFVYEKGVMPLARRTFDRFWNNIRNTTTMATSTLLSLFIPDFDSIDSVGPGRPIADAGINYSGAPLGPTTLNGAASLFATVGSFNWKIVSKPLGSTAILNGSFKVNPSFNADVEGLYIFGLTVSNTDSKGVLHLSSPSTVMIDTTRTDASIANTPITFAKDILPLLSTPNPQNFNVCTDCHYSISPYNHSGYNPSPGIQPPPPLATPDSSINLAQIKDRINYDDPFESLILTKPSGHEHYDGIRYFDSEFETVLLWILEGARP